jgi:hypothetical protein
MLFERGLDGHSHSQKNSLATKECMSKVASRCKLRWTTAARKVLIPSENKRSFLEVSGDRRWEGDPVFFFRSAQSFQPRTRCRLSALSGCTKSSTTTNSPYLEG